MPATPARSGWAPRAQVVAAQGGAPGVGARPGDSFAFLIDGEDVRVVRAPAEGHNPFACFSSGLRTRSQGLCRSLNASTSSRCPFP